MKSAADWARSRGYSPTLSDGTECHVYREVTGAWRAAQVDALQHAAALCDDYDSTDELKPILLDLADMAEGNTRAAATQPVAVKATVTNAQLRVARFGEPRPVEAKACDCDPMNRTGGEHSWTCPEYEPECTCYEIIGGHQPGCPGRAARR